MILASNSPRRRELLARITKNFKIVPPEVDETIAGGTPAGQAAREISSRKAREVAARFPDEVVIAADTIVAIGGEILGKPKDFDDAVRMLEALSGNEHMVYTGVTFRKGELAESFVCATKVVFKRLSKKQIDGYVSSGRAFDKAGAYGIQEIGESFVLTIDGDYDNVIGLPVEELKRRLAGRGLLLER